MFNYQIHHENMKKFLVETYYTCTFKTVHTLDELNDQELKKIDARNDGKVEVIDVRLSNRKTKKVGDKSPKDSNKSQKIDPIDEKNQNQFITKNTKAVNTQLSKKIKNQQNATQRANSVKGSQ